MASPMKSPKADAVNGGAAKPKASPVAPTTGETSDSDNKHTAAATDCFPNLGQLLTSCWTSMFRDRNKPLLGDEAAAYYQMDEISNGKSKKGTGGNVDADRPDRSAMPSPSHKTPSA